MAVAVVLLCACESSQSGPFTFFVIGPSGTLQSPAGSVAVGSTLRLSVQDADGEVAIENAVFEDTDAPFTVVRSRTPLVLTPTGPGTGVLQVVSRDGRSDRQTIHAGVPVFEFALSLDFARFPSPTLPFSRERLERGFVLLPETSAIIRVEALDTAGEPMLSDFDLPAWRTLSEAVAFSAAGPSAVRIERVLAGDATIAFDGQTIGQVRVAEDATAVRLQAFGDEPIAAIDMTVNPANIPSTTRLSFAVVAEDADGRTLFGVGEQGLNVSVEGPGVVEVSTLDPMIVLVQPIALGEAVLHIRQLGAELELPVAVQPQ
ncbi:MAG: hypothetical protein AAF645_09470 [Myxococcota bacterium]